VGVGALAAVLAVFDELLGVVPGAAAAGHADGQEETGDDRAHEHPAEHQVGLVPEHQGDDDRREHRDGGRQHHLADGRLGDDVDGLAVLGLLGALHDAGQLAELATDLFDDLAAGAPHGLHAERGEQVGKQTADEQTDQHPRLVDLELVDHAGAEALLQVVRVRHEEDEGGEAGGADRVALGDGLGGVADGVERIGGVAHFFRQVGHLGDAAGVVGDGAIGVDGDDDAGHGEHGHDGHGDAVQAGGAATGRFVAGEDAGGDDEHRQRRRLHGHGEALDDVGGVAGEARLGDALHRVVARRREVLGDDDDEGGHDDAADRAQEQPADAGDAGDTVLLGAEHPVGERVEECDGDEGSDADALVEGVHDVGAAAAEAHEEGADDGGDDGGAAEDQRVGDGGRDVRPEEVGQQHGGDGRDGVGLEEVGGHASAVADVVAHVVGDDGRVARVVLGDARL
jgi:hypothetical protein